MNLKPIKKSVGAGVVLVCVLLVPIVLAAEGIVGDWEFKSQFNARQMTATVTFTRNADGTYSGTWAGQGGNNALSDITFENGNVKFIRTVKLQEQEHKMTYEGALEGGKLKGKGKGEWGEFLFEAVLQGEAKAGPEAICGEWQMTITIPAREFVDKLSISKNADGSLAGKWVSERGENTISDMKFEGGKVMFTRKIKFGDREWNSTYEGTLEGDQIKGVFKSERGEMAATGTRVFSSKKADSSVVGQWELTTTSDRGTRTRILTIKEDMSGTYQMRNGQVPIKDLKVEGNKMSFRIEENMDQREIKMEFTGELEGTTLKGKFTTSRGTREVTGKKVTAEVKP